MGTDLNRPLYFTLLSFQYIPTVVEHIQVKKPSNHEPSTLYNSEACDIQVLRTSPIEKHDGGEQNRIEAQKAYPRLLFP